MNAIEPLLSLALQVYFWIVVIKYVLQIVGVVKKNKFVDVIDKLTEPYLKFIAKYLPKKVSALLPLVALLLVYWAQHFIPVLVSATLTAPFTSGGESYVGTIFGAFLLSLWSLLRVLLLIIGIASVVIFASDLLDTKERTYVKQSKEILSPFLNPLRNLLPETKKDISPVILAIIVFLIYNFILL